MMPPARSHVRTALFIDFDNMYLNLKGIDPAAGEAFATEPDRWLQWMREDMGQVVPDASEETSREILIRACYLNPVTFGRFRPYFTRSAFRVVDCPSLTSRGKNSADIYMVLDIVDTLEHSTYFDEFILLSADADFTPVMLRLRADCPAGQWSVGDGPAERVRHGPAPRGLPERGARDQPPPGQSSGRTRRTPAGRRCPPAARPGWARALAAGNAR
jgi:hypothetical protein